MYPLNSLHFLSRRYQPLLSFMLTRLSRRTRSFVLSRTLRALAWIATSNMNTCFTRLSQTHPMIVSSTLFDLPLHSFCCFLIDILHFERYGLRHLVLVLSWASKASSVYQIVLETRYKFFQFRTIFEKKILPLELLQNIMLLTPR